MPLLALGFCLLRVSTGTQGGVMDFDGFQKFLVEWFDAVREVVVALVVFFDFGRGICIVSR